MYAIHYGVPCKSVAIVWKKDLFRFLPVGQGDMKCCLICIYLRLSARVSHKAKRGAVVIHYGVPRKSAAIAWQKDLFRFLPAGQGDI